jgi:hypothetical protein
MTTTTPTLRWTTMMGSNNSDDDNDADSEMDRDDYLMSVLHGLGRPDGVYIPVDQDELRALITELKDILRNHDERPRVGRLGERELQGMLTKFKSHLHDDPDIDKEEEVRAYTIQS